MSTYHRQEGETTSDKIHRKSLHSITCIYQDEILLQVRKPTCKREATSKLPMDGFEDSVSNGETDHAALETQHWRKDSRISLHGVNHFSRASNAPKRLLWLLVMAVFWGFLTYMFVRVLLSYTAHDVYTVRKKVQVNELVFPAVSFCSTPKLDEVLLRFGASQLPGHSNTSVMAELQRILGGYNHSQNTMKRLLDLRKMFIKGKGSCRFGNYSCNFEEDFEVVSGFHFDGVCLKFNPKGAFVQGGEGSRFGLSVVLFMNNTGKSAEMALTPAISLVIDSNDAFPFPLQNGFLVSPGELTSISLQKRHFERLPAPFPRKCVHHGPTLFPGKYTSSNCKQSCYIKKALGHCGASLFPVNEVEHKCFHAMLMTENLSQHPHSCCCVLPCQEDRFIPLITRSQWPSQADVFYLKTYFASALNENVTSLSDEYIEKNFLRVNVFFDELAYEKVDDVAVWTREKVVSDIGGQMGVWVGASLFTLVEMMVYVACKLKAALHMSCKRN